MAVRRKIRGEGNFYIPWHRVAENETHRTRRTDHVGRTAGNSRHEEARTATLQPETHRRIGADEGKQARMLVRFRHGRTERGRRYYRHRPDLRSVRSRPLRAFIYAGNSLVFRWTDNKGACRRRNNRQPH